MPRAKPKRKQPSPCLPRYTLAEERALRSELRMLGATAVHQNVRLSNGEYAWTFARDYVIAQRRNRQKQNSERKQTSKSKE